MHRSGTSWLTGSLQQAGLYLGKHHSWNPHNRKGNRENPDIMVLHESILAFNHGAWDAPPECIVWAEQHKAIAKQLITINTAEQRWGFKDPRTLLMLDGWKSLLDDPVYVGIFRHPLTVARSLNKRGGMSLLQALELWVIYNTRLLDQYLLCPFPIICFDWSETHLDKGLAGVCRYLDLDEPAQVDDSSSFFDADLRHNQADSAFGLPEIVDSLYQQLTHISKQWLD